METARVYLCVDGSHASLVAAHAAIDLCRRWHSALRVAYVVEAIGGVDRPVASAQSEDMRASGRAILKRVDAMAAEQDVNAEPEVLEGVPFEAILSDARQWNADLIVMGRTGRTGAGRILLGSEAERVLEFTDRPVLIVPSTDTERY